MAKVNYQGTQAVRCGACKEAFSFDVNVVDADTGQGLFVDVPCRWCKTALGIDLKPYLTAMTIYKSLDNQGPMTLDLPEELAGKPE